MINPTRAAVLLVLFAACTTDVSPKHQSVEPKSKVQFRRAESRYASGLVEAIILGTQDRVYLHQRDIVTESDILHAQVVPDNERFGVLVIFTRQGAVKMTEATRDHLNESIAILIDGNVVLAPKVTALVGDQTVITGQLSREQAESIARSIMSSIDQPLANDSQSTIELRLAEKDPSDRLTEAVVKDTLEKVYLHQETLVSKFDVIGARIVKGYKVGIVDIELSLSGSADERLARATESHLGRMLAVVIDQKVVSAGLIITKLSSPIVISGEFSKEEAERILKRINNK